MCTLVVIVISVVVVAGLYHTPKPKPELRFGCTYQVNHEGL